MNVFVLGGSGFIGSAVVGELLAHGHRVTALARSNRAATALSAAGCAVIPGDIRVPDQWVRDIGTVDGVIHTAATFTDDQGDVDRHLVDALLRHFTVTRARSRLLYTGGCWLYGSKGATPITEDSPFDTPPDFAWMIEQRATLLDSPAVAASIVHPAMVYDWDGGVITMFMDDARAGGPIRVYGSESVRWPLVHRDDLAVLYRLALEQGHAGADYHGVAEPGVPVGDIARAVARRFGVPDVIDVRPIAELVAERGDWAQGYAFDQVMTGTLARDRLGWRPRHDSLLRGLGRDTPAP